MSDNVAISLQREILKYDPDGLYLTRLEEVVKLFEFFAEVYKPEGNGAR